MFCLVNPSNIMLICVYRLLLPNVSVALAVSYTCDKHIAT